MEEKMIRIDWEEMLKRITNILGGNVKEDRGYLNER